MSTCPGLRPRWCPARSPYRPQDYCLPLTSQRRLSPPDLRGIILSVHNYTFFGAQYTACTPAPSGSRLPLPGLPANFAPELMANLCSGGTFSTCDHPLGNSIEFPLPFGRFPTIRASLGARNDLLANEFSSKGDDRGRDHCQ